ncbi:hypothetical protein CC78DRAFT_473000, partial [Lojkania enalia]
GKLAEVEKMYQRALEGYEKAWGPDYTSILSTVNNLGNLYAVQRKLTKVEKTLLYALKGKEKVWGSNYYLSLSPIISLSLVYAD